MQTYIYVYSVRFCNGIIGCNAYFKQTKTDLFNIVVPTIDHQTRTLSQDDYGDIVLPVHLLYSRDRDMDVNSTSSVDGGGHYDILSRLS